MSNPSSSQQHHHQHGHPQHVPSRPAPLPPGQHYSNTGDRDRDRDSRPPRERRNDAERGRERERNDRNTDKGTIVGDYEIVKTLGSGSFGKVKREWKVVRDCRMFLRLRLVDDAVIGHYCTAMHARCWLYDGCYAVLCPLARLSLRQSQDIA